jgi:hypothetical protein
MYVWYTNRYTSVWSHHQFECTSFVGGINTYVLALFSKMMKQQLYFFISTLLYLILVDSPYRVVFVFEFWSVDDALAYNSDLQYHWQQFVIQMCKCQTFLGKNPTWFQDQVVPLVWWLMSDDATAAMRTWIHLDLCTADDVHDMTTYYVGI